MKRLTIFPLSITVCGLLLAVSVSVSGAAAQTPATASRQVVPLPHNLDLEEALASEQTSYDRNIANIDENRRGAELQRTRRIAEINADPGPAPKGPRIAAVNEEHARTMAAIERQRAAVEQQHAQRVASLRQQFGAIPSTVTVDRFDAVGDPAQKNSQLASEANDHRRRLANIEENRRSARDDHRRLVDGIQKDGNKSADEKAKLVADADENLKVELAIIDRQQATEDKRHANHVAEIAARFGPASGSGSGTPMLKGRVVENVGKETPDASGGLPPTARERLQQISDEMQRAATDLGANMDQASGRFMQGVADLVGQQAQFMAQKPGAPVAQVGKAVIEYLTADHNDNDRKLYDAAVQAVEDFQKDPAYFLGSHADAFLPGNGAKTTAAGAGARTAKAAAALEDVARIEKAASTVKAVQHAASELATYGSGTGAGAGLPRGVPRLNPLCGDKNCVPVSISQAMKWDSRGKIHEPIPPTKRGLTAAETEAAFKEFFGKNDIPDLAHSPARRISQQEGIAWPMSKADIEKELLKAGPGSQGIVIVDLRDAQAGGLKGHAFNVRNTGGKVIFWDAQNEMDGAFHFDNALRSALYRVR